MDAGGCEIIFTNSSAYLPTFSFLSSSHAELFSCFISMFVCMTRQLVLVPEIPIYGQRCCVLTFFFISLRMDII